MNVNNYVTYPRDMITSRFMFSSFFSLIFLFVPCGALRWLHVSFLLHVKYTMSYRLAHIHIKGGNMQLVAVATVDRV